LAEIAKVGWLLSFRIESKLKKKIGKFALLLLVKSSLPLIGRTTTIENAVLLFFLLSIELS
jgi:hypothetical protein